MFVCNKNYIVRWKMDEDMKKPNAESKLLLF